MIPLVMSVIAKTETFQRDMAKAGNSVNKFGTTASKTTAMITKMGRSLMMMAGVGGGLYMLQRGLRGAVSEASRAQETIGKFNVVFGENAIEASRWAEAFGNSVGRSTTDIQEWMASVQDLFVPLGFARKEATGLSESLVKLAVDVASFSNKVDADVIRDFTSALVGNHETVRKYGIIISENAIKQEALNQGINKSYKELTDLEKVSLRMALIQKGSTDAQGDAIRTSDNYANQVKRINANYQELSVTIGEQLIPALSDILVRMNAFAENGNFVASMHERIAAVYEFADAVTNLDELFALIGSTKWSYKDLAEQHRLLADVARAKAELNILAPQLPQKQQPQWSDEGMSDEDVWLGSLPGDTVVDNAEANKQILDATREQLASVRSMHDKTRQEKIQMLEDYKMAHFGHTKEIEAAEQLLKDEILSLHKSRVDAMVVYNAELREDMQESTLYTKEKFAEAARSIEGSMSGAFRSVISEGANWRDAMAGFFNSIGDAFAKMVSDMIARAIMARAFGVFVGAPAGAGGDGSTVDISGSSFSNSQAVYGSPATRHTGWIPAGVPSFQRGRGLKSNEMAAIIEKDEMLVPNKQIIKKGRGGSEPTINIENYIERVDATDMASFNAQLYRSKQTVNNINLAGLKSNSGSRRFNQ